MHDSNADCNTALCPLCGQPNGCAMAGGSTATQATPCWCTTVVFTPQLLQRVPEHLRNRACVCRACAQSGAASGAAERSAP